MTAAIITVASISVVLAALLGTTLLAWRLEVRVKDKWRTMAAEQTLAAVLAQKELELSRDRERTARDTAARYRSQLTTEQRATARALQETHDAIEQVQSNPATTVQQHIDLGKRLLGYDATLPSANTDDDNGDEDRTPTVRLTATKTKSTVSG
jgi:outer membrane murein-binding lipoprotein Lpp